MPEIFLPAATINYLMDVVEYNVRQGNRIGSSIAIARYAQAICDYALANNMIARAAAYAASERTN